MTASDLPSMSPEIQRVFDALNDITDDPKYQRSPAPDSEAVLIARIMEALVHLDGRVQELEHPGTNRRAAERVQAAVDTLTCTKCGHPLKGHIPVCEEPSCSCEWNGALHLTT